MTAIPEGYALVPIEPTEAMLTAGVPRLMASGRGSGALCFAYRAMIAAAPHVVTDDGHSFERA